jgi:hypothetical protein
LDVKLAFTDKGNRPESKPERAAFFQAARNAA